MPKWLGKRSQHVSYLLVLDTRQSTQYQSIRPTYFISVNIKRSALEPESTHKATEHPMSSPLRYFQVVVRIRTRDPAIFYTTSNENCDALRIDYVSVRVLFVPRCRDPLRLARAFPSKQPLTLMAFPGRKSKEAIICPHAMMSMPLRSNHAISAPMLRSNRDL